MRHPFQIKVVLSLVLLLVLLPLSPKHTLNNESDDRRLLDAKSNAASFDFIAGLRLIG
jgi:hypothetical protein